MKNEDGYLDANNDEGVMGKPTNEGVEHGDGEGISSGVWD